MQKKPIESVLKEYTTILMVLPGVVGTGQGEYQGKPCIKVFTTKMSPELLGQIPPLLDGYRVIVEETGEFRALST
ncbi:hypothetical protein ACFLUR_02290 [Chloroflexota bacterium]